MIEISIIFGAFFVLVCATMVIVWAYTKSLAFVAKRSEHPIKGVLIYATYLIFLPTFLMPLFAVIYYVRTKTSWQRDDVGALYLGAYLLAIYILPMYFFKCLAKKKLHPLGIK